MSREDLVHAQALTVINHAHDYAIHDYNATVLLA